MNSEKLVERLQRLIGECDELAKSLELAAAHLHQPAQRSWAAFARERVELTEELSALVRQCGGSPQPAATAKGTVRRAISGVMRIVQSHSDDALLEDCRRRAHALMRVYEETCEMNPPIAIESVLMRQYATIKSIHYDRRAMAHPPRFASRESTAAAPQALS